MPVKTIYNSHDERMVKTLESFKRDLASIRTGRATPSLLDRVQIDYYGTLTPVNQVANVSIPDPRSIMIQPWESTLVPAIEKAIMQSDLGLTPNSDGAVIRLNLPQLTQERRAEFVKIANKFFINKKVYTYGFDLVLTQNHIESEWLIYNGTKSDKLIYRYSSADHSFTLGDHFKNNIFKDIL